MDRHVSVIIPAHNEAAVIERCLRAAFLGASERELEVIVACNGCTDGTEELALAIDPRVKVVVSEVASKYAALNLGDSVATHDIRAYLDADTVISAGALDLVADQLESGRSLATAPEIAFDLSKASFWAKRYLRVWARNSYFDDGLIGAGFYAFGPEGRARFDEFPPIIADDLFVYELFTADERQSTTGATFTPLLPTRVRDILRVNIRQQGGHPELVAWREANGIESVEIEQTPRRSAREAVADPIGVAVYLVVKTLGQINGKLKFLVGDLDTWQRDDSARASV